MIENNTHHENKRPVIELIRRRGDAVSDSVEQALALRRRGLSLEEIAERMHCTRLDVFRLLQMAGVYSGR